MISRASLETRQRFLLEFTSEILKNYPGFRKENLRQNLPEDEREAPLKTIERLLENTEIWAIECPSPDRFIILNHKGELKLSKLSLDEQEIQDIIKKLAEKSGSQVQDTIFTFKTQNLEISGIISEEAGSRFLIEKIS